MIPTDKRFYGEFNNQIDDAAVARSLESKYIYEITVSNQGGLVMPVILDWIYTDGSHEVERMPAEIWRVNEHSITKLFAKDKEVARVVLDPNKETADTNTEDNTFPKVSTPSKFDQLKKKTN